MNTEVIKEAPAFTLQGSSYNGASEAVVVSYAELRAAAVGTQWEAFSDDNCGRDVCEESAEVVYRTTRGCAVLFCSWGSTDSPKPENWEDPPKLVWFEFR